MWCTTRINTRSFIILIVCQRPCNSVKLFADKTSLSISGKDPEVLCDVINNDLAEIQECSYFNKLSLNVLKTLYMIFIAQNTTATDLDININEVRIERVYETKFLGVLVDSQLT